MSSTDGTIEVAGKMREYWDAEVWDRKTVCIRVMVWLWSVLYQCRSGLWLGLGSVLIKCGESFDLQFRTPAFHP